MIFVRVVHAGDVGEELSMIQFKKCELWVVHCCSSVAQSWSCNVGENQLDMSAVDRGVSMQ